MSEFICPKCGNALSQSWNPPIPGIYSLECGCGEKILVERVAPKFTSQSSFKHWYENPSHFIHRIESQGWGITDLMGRKDDSGWEYAMVFWRYGLCKVLCTFKNGVAKEGDDV